MIAKGTKIKRICTTNDPMLKGSVYDSTLVFEVVKVNAKTYTIKCIEGYMVGSMVKMAKDFPAEFDNSYGHVSTIVMQ